MSAFWYLWPWWVVPALLAVVLELLARRGRGKEHRRSFLVAWVAVALTGAAPLGFLVFIFLAFGQKDVSVLDSGVPTFVLTAIWLVHCVRTLRMLLDRSSHVDSAQLR